MADVEELATPVSGSLNTAPAAINLSNDALVYWSDSGGTWMQVATGSGTAGTVTSIAAGTGITLSPSPITTTGSVSLTVPVSIANGGTGATTAPAALANLGGISGNQTITLSGDSTGSGATAITTTTTGLQGRAIVTTAPTVNQVLQWNGTAWAPGTVSGGATIADVAPVVSPGALWWDSVGGQLYLRYDDGNSVQWVPSTNQPGPQGPTGATGATGAQGPNWQVGSGLALNTGTTPNTIDVATPYLALTGGTMTGLLTLSGTPTSGLHAATKTYVDAIINPTVPTRQVFTTGSGTYTRPTGVKWIEIVCVGGGGGGSGSGTGTVGSGGNGGSTTFGTLTAGGGGGCVWASAGGAGGTASGGDYNIGGAQGNLPTVVTVTSGTGQIAGGTGGSSSLGGAAAGIWATNGSNAVTNSGSGGAGGGVSAAATGALAGGGGGAGATCGRIIGSPASTYSYAVGASGSPGTNGTSGQAGGVGGSGIIIVTEHYNY
jgi:hypothetical protein